jgi:gamma-glutamylcysteine synthetase
MFLKTCKVVIKFPSDVSDLFFFIWQDFMAGKLPSTPGELPTLNDWENHLTTIYPEVHPFIW